MQVQSQINRNVITLKGSAQTVAEFFKFGVNNILYQRGVYPEEAFEAKKQYGLSLWQTTDEKLNQYLTGVLTQTRAWLEEGCLRQLVLVITEAGTKEVLERWTFDIDTNKDVISGSGPLPDKPEKEITSEIQAIMRQITASVTFLPLLETRCTIDILVYTTSLDSLPEEWEDSAPKTIANAEIVSLRGFSTKVHGVKAMVAYKAPCDDIL
ncbi:hypothetical protein CEUSTIGMA_g3522.t1 [Chlamydomonas eustigma]|uniref:HORMA domain-containing protein n=1 Tax=Chlamydomonas eustigma TaxID=1157962 RepID=A0A250WZF6_9CHLO|nr:hypothetical protein CEUSTIGMA_g3522.t1 [Chlamydomonas eustigma]|eukprot:GAX76079.1 hypothetical protein CEUSTIGMA_g3522.t1 [Chlamydomonas eustigma]